MCGICYDDLGCFETREVCGEIVQGETAEDRHQQLLGQLPDPPADVGTTFLLYEEGLPFNALEFETDKLDLNKLEAFKFNKEKDIKFIIHGIMSPNYYGLLEYIKEMFMSEEYKVKIAIGHEKRNPSSTGPTEPKMAYSDSDFSFFLLPKIMLNLHCL